MHAIYINQLKYHQFAPIKEEKHWVQPPMPDAYRKDARVAFAKKKRS